MQMVDKPKGLSDNNLRGVVLLLYSDYLKQRMSRKEAHYFFEIHRFLDAACGLGETTALAIRKDDVSGGFYGYGDSDDGHRHPYNKDQLRILAIAEGLLTGTGGFAINTNEAIRILLSFEHSPQKLIYPGQDGKIRRWLAGLPVSQVETHIRKGVNKTVDDLVAEAEWLSEPSTSRQEAVKTALIGILVPGPAAVIASYASCVVKIQDDGQDIPRSLVWEAN